MTGLSSAKQGGAARWMVATLIIAWTLLLLGSYYRKVVDYARGAGGVYVLLDGAFQPRFEYLLEMVGASIVALAGAAVLIVAAIAAGTFACRLLRWDSDEILERIVIRASVGIGSLAYIGLGLAAVGAYRLWVLRLVVAILVGAALMRERSSLSPWRWRLTSARTRDRAEAAFLAIAVLAGAFALAWALAPQHEYDAVWYHLYFPRLYLEQGTLVDLRTEYVSLYPMTWSLWFGYGLAFGGPTTAALLHYACLPLTAALVYAATRRWFPRASAWLAVALFVTVPTVIWEASTAYNDLAIAFHATVVAYTVLRYLETGRLGWILVAGINMGIALASKHVSLLLLTLVCPAMLGILYWRDRRVWSAFMPPLLVGLIALAMALPWYTRSFLAAGNPVFPELYDIFGAPPDRWDAQTDRGLAGFFSRFGRPRTIWHQLTLPWDMTVHAARYGGSLGPLFLLLLPAWLVPMSRRTRDEAPAGSERIARLWFAILAIGFLVMWASPLASFQVRWLVVVVPLFAILSADGAGRLSAWARATWSDGTAHGMAVVLAGLLVLNLPPFIPLHEPDRVEWRGWLTHVRRGGPAPMLGAESRESFLRRHVPSYGA